MTLIALLYHRKRTAAGDGAAGHACIYAACIMLDVLIINFFNG